jgi:alpha-beta hydrolase superfamily lysophospholipase
MIHERVAAGGLDLALHAWPCPDAPTAVVFYLHGTQSHGGWLFETGPRLAAAGASVWALDRRGSGASAGARGDASSFRDWLDDYRAALALVRGRHPGVPLMILGQSLGGLIATALAVETAAMHEALLLSAPAFDLLHGKLAPDKLEAICRDRLATLYPVKVKDEDYTSDPDRLGFMKRDERMARALTGRFLAAQIDLEAHVRDLPRGALPRPSTLVLAANDSIIRPDVVRERFRELAPAGRIVELPGRDHYLEFSDQREAWWELVIDAARSPGAPPPR